MEELGRKQERSPARRSGHRDVPKNEETPLDAVPWEGFGPGDSLESDVPSKERNGRLWRGEPWVQNPPGAERNGTNGPWSGNEPGRDIGRHRHGDRPV